jgi:hypothetical protein
MAAEGCHIDSMKFPGCWANGGIKIPLRSHETSVGERVAARIDGISQAGAGMHLAGAFRPPASAGKIHERTIVIVHVCLAPRGDEIEEGHRVDRLAFPRPL